MRNITRRPAAESDRTFLFELYASTRDAEMRMVPWPAEQKRAFLEMQFAAQLQSYAATHPDATHEVIYADGQPAGRLYLHRASDFHILDMTVAPGMRSGGIGSHILHEILAEADQRNAAVTIYIEVDNPSVRLFERLGFSAASANGFQVFMRRPQSAPASSAPGTAGLP